MASTVKTLPSAAKNSACGKPAKELKSARYESKAADKSLDSYEKYILRQARAVRAGRVAALRPRAGLYRGELRCVFQSRH